jgi:hypothetical protein
MDPMLNKQQDENYPADAPKIKQSSLYGTFLKPMEFKLGDEQVVILGLAFTEVDMSVEPESSPLRRTIFVIEDLATGEVQVSECSRRSHGIALLRTGKLGVIFEKRFGKDYLGKVRVWWAHTAGEIEKYQIETYLVARMADKKRAGDRIRVMRNQYERMNDDLRQKWRAKYPYAAEVVLKDHEDYRLRRA